MNATIKFPAHLTAAKLNVWLSEHDAEYSGKVTKKVLSAYADKVVQLRNSGCTAVITPGNVDELLEGSDSVETQGEKLASEMLAEIDLKIEKALKPVKSVSRDARRVPSKRTVEKLKNACIAGQGEVRAEHLEGAGIAAGWVRSPKNRFVEGGFCWRAFHAAGFTVVEYIRNDVIKTVPNEEVSNG